MANKISAADSKVIEEFGFEIGEPPVFAQTRRSKHADRWDAAMRMAIKISDNPQPWLKMMTYDNSASPNNLARQINADDRPEFYDESGDFEAKVAADDAAKSSFSIWIKFVPTEVAEAE